MSKEPVQDKLSKREAMVIFFIAVVILAVFLFVSLVVKKPATAVEITVDGKLYGTYSLQSENEIHINTELGENHIEIGYDGTCRMSGADCPDKICVKQGKIDKRNETITCLPHRVVIRAVGGDAEVDEFVK